MTRRFWLFAILGVSLLGPWARVSSGQISAAAAQLNGTVRDPSGATIAKASITLRNTDTNRISNADGLYVFGSVLPGPYELVTEASGFAKSTQAGIVLTVGQTATLDVTLRV